MLKGGKQQVLIDGFPRNEENRAAFESQVSLLSICPFTWTTMSNFIDLLHGEPQPRQNATSVHWANTPCSMYRRPALSQNLCCSSTALRVSWSSGYCRGKRAGRMTT